jgi:hypothetical protein
LRIICNSEEKKILIRNCNNEHCEFCFLKELCSDINERGNIVKLIEEEKQ